MNRWDEQFEDHPIHVTLKEIDELLNVEIDDTSSEEQSEKRRISKLMDVFKEVVKNLDPELTPYHLLDNIHSAAENTRNQLTNYNSNRDHNYLKNANSSLSNVLAHLSQLLSIAKRSKVMKPVKVLEKSLDELTEAICNKKESLEGEIQKISELSQSQNEELENLSNSINTKKQEIDSLIPSWEEKFNDEISPIIEDANDKHEEILKLHGLVAGDSVAAGYLKSAEDEKRQANFWRWMTICFIILSATWLIFSYAMNVINFSWQQIIITLPVTGILVFGAAYSSKQSSLHRQNEKKTRWFSLEMNAIGPFIESLPPEKCDELKFDLGKRLFGQQHDDTEKGILGIDENTIKIIKNISDALGNK